MSFLAVFAPSLLAFSLLLASCSQTTHAVQPSPFGTPSTERQLEQALASGPGPIRFEKIRAATWSVPRSGLVNLDHEHARQAGLTDGPEPIEIYFYALHHPTRGTYLVDTGVARAFTDPEGELPVSWIVRQAMNLEDLHVEVSTADWLARQTTSIRGVLFTHLHLDHIMGLADLPASVPLYVGPHEADDTKFLNLFARGTTDENLEPFGALTEFSPGPAETGGLVDLFGDGSVFGLHRPGHTAGSMAYLVRSSEGLQLLTGDCSHTAWGWQHDVEPGTFNTDQSGAAKSFLELRQLVARHPDIHVHLGHQSL
ncbi:MAG TPA: MBL fold metallo-hydrolase [Polyangiaceae bacterium]|nr:MBL fold metallo-hydrolase [Polyangiaceae bacterium]